MELKNYIEILRRRRWIIAITVLVAIGVATMGFLRITPNYVATTTLRVAPRSGALVDYGSLEYAIRLKNTYAELAVKGPTLDLLQQRLGNINRSNEVLKENIAVEFPLNNELMSVVVRDSDPILAASIANTVSELLIDENKKGRTGRTFIVEIIDPAVTPTRPDMVVQGVIVVLAALISLGAGLGLAILMENMDTTLHNTAQIANLVQLPILAKVPRIRAWRKTQCYNGSSAEGEAFRQLRTSIALESHDKPFRQIMITSAEPGAGKSLVSANLGYSLGHLRKKVVIVDTDMRLPTLHKFFKLSNEVGLGNVLEGQAELRDVIRYVDTHKVHVITSGTTLSNPADLIDSNEMRTLVEQLVDQFDVVLFDSPAFLSVADSAILSRMVDGVLLVVRCSRSQSEHVQTVYDQLVSGNVNLIGVVANSADSNNRYNYYQKSFRKK